jgi:hypothetical protein
MDNEELKFDAELKFIKALMQEVEKARKGSDWRDDKLDTPAILRCLEYVLSKEKAVE